MYMFIYACSYIGIMSFKLNAFDSSLDYAQFFCALFGYKSVKNGPIWSFYP
jgi:hypothetical protein